MSYREQYDFWLQDAYFDEKTKEELRGIAGDEKEIEEYAVRLRKMGAKNVLVSMAGAGSLLVTEEGRSYRMGTARGTVKNSVGAGDSMVAGFLAGYLENGDYEHALKMGTAAGGATAFSDGLGTREQIMELYEQLDQAGRDGRKDLLDNSPIL